MPLRLLALFCLSCTVLLSQSTTATLLGHIQDPAGAGVPEALVRVQNEANNQQRTTKASSAGDFTVTNLEPGHYTVTVQHPGFSRLERKGVELNVDQIGRLTLKLAVGAVSETVEVTGGSPVINTENAVQGEVIALKELQEIPLDGRDYSDLAYQVPGVERTAQSGQGSGFAINGARSDNTNFVLDGFNDQGIHNGDIEVRPPLDSFQEFRVQTSNYAAEFGRLAGGVVTMVLKSGSNQPHGSLFEFLRNDAIDARNFFAATKPPLRRNQFGATLSGPVWLPKIYNGKDKTFFLMSWESFRGIDGLSKLAVVPTALEDAGNFSQTVDATGKLKLVKDPFATGNCTATDASACFPGNKIPASRIIAAAPLLLAYYPAPNRPGQANNFTSNLSQPSTWNNFAGKLDQRLSSKDSFSLRGLVRDTDGSNVYKASSIPGFGSTFNQNDRLFGLTYTRIFTASRINELRLGYTRSSRDEKGQNQGIDFPSKLGIPGLPSDPLLTGFPSFSITGYAAIGDFNKQPVLFAANNYQLGNTTTFVTGRHTVKFGGDVLRTQLNEKIYGSQRGTFAFTGGWTGNALADLDLGLLNTSQRVLSASPNYLTATLGGLFAQDDWKITSRLTLNLGLRWEIQPPVKDRDGRLSKFMPEIGKLVVASSAGVQNFDQLIANSSLAGLVVQAKDVGLPAALSFTRYTDFAPRVGLAWRPFGGEKTVFRSGYGIFYGNTQFEPLRIDLSSLYPFSITENYTRVTTNPAGLTLSNPFPAGKAALGGVTTVIGFDSHPPAQYVQSWNATVEREIGFGAAVEVAYIGSKGTHLSRRWDYNQPFPYPTQKINGALPRPFNNLGSIYYYADNSNSTYNSGVVTLRKRFNNGLFFRVNYVWSKSLDDTSQVSSSPAGGFQGAQNARDLFAEHGRSDFDTKHSFLANFSYEIPRSGNKFLNYTISGFSISGSIRAYSGQPFTPQVSGADTTNGQAPRPDRLANGALSDPGPNRWFDTSAFQVLPLGTYRFGNSGRNILNGPGYTGVNLGLSKRFTIREGHSLQFRWEVFNTTNRANFLIPVDTVNTSNAATITSANIAREMQFALKYQF